MSDHSSAPASAEVDQDRRGFLTFATAATGVVGVAFATVPFIASWSPSERARAAGAPVEVDVTAEPGQMVVSLYRKKFHVAPHAGCSSSWPATTPS
jgi:ubiquinol-cytochrome c reductase iron-sulfur subunit